MRPEIHKKVWGEELWIANNELYCGKILLLKRNYRCSYHCHPVKDETFHILEGSIKMRHKDSEFVMTVGDTLRIHPGEFHSFEGITDAEILEISTPHTDDDVVRKDSSGKIT